jgi:hypothetical protein
MWNLLTQGWCFPWHFRVKVAGHVQGRVWSSEFLCVPGSGAYHQVMEPGAAQRLQRWGIGSGEVQVVLPILPMVSSFPVCRFGEGFVSHWLWDPMGAF